MKRFLFNSEGLHLCEMSLFEFTSMFKSTLIHFSKLIDVLEAESSEVLSVEKGIVLTDAPNSIKIGTDNFVLSDVIEQLDRNTKSIAFSYLTKYPIEATVNISDKTSDKLIDDSPKVTLSEAVDYDAPYLYFFQLIGNNSWSVPFSQQLEKNLLPIELSAPTVPDVTIPNFYGEESNTLFFRRYIDELEDETRPNLESLRSILGNAILSGAFERSYKKLKSNEQRVINDHFKLAKQRLGKNTAFEPDGDLIKDVSDSKAFQPNARISSVYELRVFEPVPFRVYFIERGSNVYVYDIGKKSGGNQDTEIKSAGKYLKNMIDEQTH